MKNTSQAYPKLKSLLKFLPIGCVCVAVLAGCREAPVIQETPEPPVRAGTISIRNNSSHDIHFVRIDGKLAMTDVMPGKTKNLESYRHVDTVTDQLVTELITPGEHLLEFESAPYLSDHEFKAAKVIKVTDGEQSLCIILESDFSATPKAE
jgi:hypothetical protein